MMVISFYRKLYDDERAFVGIHSSRNYGFYDFKKQIEFERFVCMGIQFAKIWLVENGMCRIYEFLATLKVINESVPVIPCNIWKSIKFRNLHTLNEILGKNCRTLTAVHKQFQRKSSEGDIDCWPFLIINIPYMHIAPGFKRGIITLLG